MKRVIFVILIIFLLSYVVSATHISVEDFEDDAEFQDPSEAWYNYSEAIGGNAGAWNASVNTSYGFTSEQSLLIYNARVDIEVNYTSYSNFTFYYMNNNTGVANGGWFRLYNGTNWLTSPIVILIHFDDDFYYENGLGPPIALGMPIAAETWYKIELVLNWTTNECNFTVYNSTDNTFVTRGWDRMYNIAQDGISMYHFRDSGGGAEWIWIDDITFPLSQETSIIETTITIEEARNALFVLGLAVGIVFIIIAGAYFYVRSQE